MTHKIVNNMLKNEDEVYEKKKEESLTARSFLAALKEHLDPEKAFEVARSAFARYMTGVYERVLSSTKPGTQERFDCFREFHAEYAKITPYLEILESNETVLKVVYHRCPFFEISRDEGLGELAYAFCLSDPTFTQNVLPGVKFSRNKIIAKGDGYCDNTWEFKKEKS